MSEADIPRQAPKPGHPGVDNLRRGNPKGYDGKVKEREAEYSAQRDRITTNASSQPGLVIEELFAEAAKFAVGRLKKMNRVKGEIARSDIEVVRETRQLADRAFEIIQARGQVAAADALLATLDARMEAVAPILERCARSFEQPEAA